LKLKFPVKLKRGTSLLPRGEIISERKANTNPNRISRATCFVWIGIGTGKTEKKKKLWRFYEIQSYNRESSFHKSIRKRQESGDVSSCGIPFAGLCSEETRKKRHERANKKPLRNNGINQDWRRSYEKPMP
jgi:hypothetical protein